MERKNTFNEIAKEYDKYRPSYPDQLFTDILAFTAIKPGDAILEIGCGTGQATKGFVDLGYDHVTCIELGQNLAERAREKFKNSPNVNIIHSPFETWPSEKRKFKLAISGTAFHFIQPQEAGYCKVLDLLGDDGAIALFWTVHIPSFDEVSNRIRESYKKYAPQLDDSTNPTLEQMMEERAALTLKDGLFTDLEVKRYICNHTYTADEYISLLNTNSRHRLIPDHVRYELFGEIKEAIEEDGGRLLKPQAVVLFLAKKSKAKKNMLP
ncbi:class I SAM-dependent methyltransferase [Paenibacillus arenilitoris]|uniref:Class I SAM-dependent methyltransferase n=1 Tax=Paenibacillus arenilitoris TaxID=2772299 RepID=A0A927CLR4_9BACL|nr:class I SAM-dependent methyltransferase [Paenibacillus arenilitoris]MBD2869137.1 class I SAM-dependent methyltransferase [Paenibacillus arenilitoris]